MKIRILVQAVDDTGSEVLAESVVMHHDPQDEWWHSTRMHARTYRPRMYRHVCQAIGEEMRHVSSVARRKENRRRT